MKESLFVLILVFSTIKSDPYLGVYKGPAPYGPNLVDLYSSWLGIPVKYGLDFQASAYWTDIEGGTWQLGPWSNWVNARPNGERIFILSIPMLPSQDAGTLEEGAAGTYNTHFSILANNLVKYNLNNTVIRIGWEFNGGWYAWRAGGNTTAWPLFFQQIVTTMRNVNGSSFTVLWNPNAGYAETQADTLYPGDNYVDWIGLDSYDASYSQAAYLTGAPQRGVWYANESYILGDAVEYEHQVWKALRNNTGVVPLGGLNDWMLLVNQTALNNSRVLAMNDYISGFKGLNFWAAFAKTHGKPFVIPEWGVWTQISGHGGGDNPYYIQKMHDFIFNSDNNVFFYSYCDVYALDGNHLLQPTNGVLPYFPESSALFQSLFGNHTTTSGPQNSSSLSAVTSTTPVVTSVSNSSHTKALLPTSMSDSIHIVKWIVLAALILLY